MRFTAVFNKGYNLEYSVVLSPTAYTTNTPTQRIARVGDYPLLNTAVNLTLDKIKLYSVLTAGAPLALVTQAQGPSTKFHLITIGKDGLCC